MKLPYLPFEQWKESRLTLHLILQIMGKIKFSTTPRKNHWWNITLFVSTKGFSTHPIPMDDGINTFEIIFNVHTRSIKLSNSKGEENEIMLNEGYNISEFYQDILRILSDWGVYPKFIDKPFDMGIDKPFVEITAYHHYDWKSIQLFWQMMLWNDGVFKEFSGKFYGKTCPVHIYWHHLDLAVTRFSGKKAPAMNPKARISDKDAYSHEVISFGFWAGDDNLPEPAYYAYAAPSPDGLDQEILLPESAFWNDANGSPMAILKYKDLLNYDNPRKTLLEFLESVYQAGAKLANWDIDSFSVPPLSNL